ARGMTIAGRSGAIVTAPADAWVAYAGPFRSFGHLLILNAGGGYYILLAGMERMTVELGQFVIAGEPVAMMGKTAAQAVSQPAAGGADTNQPVLYVEFRKDGASIDPAPWWARSDMGKVRG
ncbi:MAG: murein hydrolase activator EnvC family protein, partial [Beijerinckiaceae bacterium]